MRIVKAVVLLGALLMLAVVATVIYAEDDASDLGAFELVEPANETVFTDLADFTTIKWTESEGAEKYRFELERYDDDNGGDSTIPTFDLSGNEDDDDYILDLLFVAEDICADGFCTITVTDDVRELLDDGTYEWTVEALKPDDDGDDDDDDRYPENGYFKFTVRTGDDDDNNVPLGEFFLLTPEDGTVFTDLADFTSTRWTKAEGAVKYRFVLERVRIYDDDDDYDDRGDGDSAVPTFNLATDDDDDDDDDDRVLVLTLDAAAICDDEVCTLEVGNNLRSLLRDGAAYEWTVEALKRGYDDDDDYDGDVAVITTDDEDDYDGRYASNAPFIFFVDTDDSGIPGLPGRFTLISPRNGAVLDSPQALTTVVWSRAAGAVTYNFELKRLGQNAEKIVDVRINARDICGAELCRLPVSADLQNQLSDGNYRWKVFASDGQNVRPASNSPSFFVIDSDGSVLPGNLNWIAPVGTLNDTIGNPDYVWEAFEGATAYDFYLARANFLAIPIFFERLPAADYCDDVVCTFDPTELDRGFSWLTNGLYNVYVRPDNGDWSGPFEFNVNVPRPEPVSNLQALTSTESAPTISWTLEGDADFSSWFRVYVTQANAPAIPAFDRWYNRYEACGSEDSTECAVEIDLLFNGDYSAYVLNWGPGGFAVGGLFNNSGWVGPADFSVDVPSPARPTDMTVVDTQNLTLSFTGDPNATWHQVWVGSLSFETAYTEWIPASKLDCLGGGTCTVIPDVALDGGTYAWYARSWGPGGLSSGGVQGWEAGPQFDIP